MIGLATTKSTALPLSLAECRPNSLSAISTNSHPMSDGQQHTLNLRGGFPPSKPAAENA